jgi:hypothetical protein
MMQFKQVERKPEDLTYPHQHVPKLEMQLSRRVLDAEKDAKIHMLAWRYNAKRSQWEAQCEWADVIYYAMATDADIDFRKGRTFDDSSNGKNP